MTKDEWIVQIENTAKEAGTYKPFFVNVIETLAGILENRDKAQDTFEKTGGQVIVKHTNKAGATNLEQNPALRLLNDLNRDALGYWRELGLTPKALKAINEESMKARKMDALTEALLELESGNSD